MLGPWLAQYGRLEFMVPPRCFDGASDVGPWWVHGASVVRLLGVHGGSMASQWFMRSPWCA